MSADPYSALVREYFAGPEYCGDLEAASVVGVEDQGVRLRLSARCRDGRIEALRFRAWGCPHVIAACEALCRHYEGRSAEELGQFGVAEIMSTLSVPVEKTGRILVLQDAARALGQSISAGAAPI